MIRFRWSSNLECILKEGLSLNDMWFNSTCIFQRDSKGTCIQACFTESISANSNTNILLLDKKTNKCRALEEGGLEEEEELGFKGDTDNAPEVWGRPRAKIKFRNPAIHSIHDIPNHIVRKRNRRSYHTDKIHYGTRQDAHSCEDGWNIRKVTVIYLWNIISKRCCIDYFFSRSKTSW